MSRALGPQTGQVWFGFPECSAFSSSAHSLQGGNAMNAELRRLNGAIVAMEYRGPQFRHETNG